MNNYTIFADSACDIAPDILDKWGVKYLNLTFKFDDEDTEYLNYDINVKEFYEKMRSGKTGRTSGVNIESFRTAFLEELNAGNDILYIAFSSGLSTTYNSGWAAATELKEQYPDRKIVVIDSLCASAGYGLILKFAVEMKEDGKTVEEISDFIMARSLNVCHWFTVDDLTYLKRGGRISSTAAIVGNVLNLKPVMHVNDEGKLVNAVKARGRKAALKTLAAKYGELAEDTKGRIFVCHSDCLDEVKELEKIFMSEYGVSFELITDIGPVIGIHAGPGTIAVFFFGKYR